VRYNEALHKFLGARSPLTRMIRTNDIHSINIVARAVRFPPVLFQRGERDAEDKDVSGESFCFRFANCDLRP